MKWMNFNRGLALGTSLSIVAGLTGCGESNVVTVSSEVETTKETAALVDKDMEKKKEKPNILYLVVDDMGFGDLGCYGSSIDTPSIDALAKAGIQYTNYNTCPMSSPARASMLTGYDSNFAGMGATSEIVMGDIVENIQGDIRPECAPITHSLKENGYETLTVGKWHISACEHFMPGEDHAKWPSGMGFDKNFNFVISQANQFQPGGMIEGDETAVIDFSDPEFHLTNFLVDKTLEYIDEVPEEKPFFAYVGLGAMHGPFNVPQEYIDKYKGKFDEGWDVEREKIFERQKELGIFSQDAQLPPRSEKVPAWDSLSETEKAVARKHMEVYAGFLTHTDEQIGRLVDELKKRDEFDNTIFVVVSDNGANSNGGTYGGFAHDVENLFARPVEEQYELMDQFGSAQWGTQYNSGWAMVSNTPFREFKKNAYMGGTRTACVITWPDGIKEPGRMNNDMIAVYDIPVTMLELSGTAHLEKVNGVQQEPLHGQSFAETFFSSQERKNPRTHYAAMLFTDMSYTDGEYTIVTNPYTGKWELYTTEDETQFSNLADQMPNKVDELVEEFETVKKEQMNAQNIVMDIAIGTPKEIVKERYGKIAEEVYVYMENGTWPQSEDAQETVKIINAVTLKLGNAGYAGIGSAWYRPPYNEQSLSEYIYHIEDGPFHAICGPLTGNRSFSVKTDIELTADSEGVIFANGGIDGGYVIYVKDGKLVAEYNYLGERQKLVAADALYEGRSNLEMIYEKETYNTGTLILKVNGEETAREKINSLPVYYSYDYISIGEDVGSKVSLEYDDNFKFTGKVSDVKIMTGDDLWE